jgi:tetratricopeptide (TPR) repeat protein
MSGLDEALRALAERRFAEASALAERALADGDLDGESSYERGLPADLARPNRALALYVLGTARSETGDPRGAIELYDRALQLTPGDRVLYSNRAIALRDLGDEEGALADFGRALAIEPGYTHARANRARLHAKRGELEVADEDYQLLLAIANTPEHRAEWNAVRERRGLSHDDDTLTSLQQAARLS